MKSDINSIQKDIQKLRDSISLAAEHTSDKAFDILKDAQDKTECLLKEAQEHAAVASESVNDYARENPGKMVLLAALAGFAAGYLTRK